MDDVAENGNDGDGIYTEQEQDGVFIHEYATSGTDSRPIVDILNHCVL